MKAIDKVIVTVSQHTVFLAEAAISNCSQCSTSPGLPFEQILGVVGNHLPGEAIYFLPVLGVCPYCKRQLSEESIVIPRPHRLL